MLFDHQSLIARRRLVLLAWRRRHGSRRLRLPARLGHDPDARLGVVARHPAHGHEGAERVQQILVERCARHFGIQPLHPDAVPVGLVGLGIEDVALRDLVERDGGLVLVRHHHPIARLDVEDERRALAGPVDSRLGLLVGIQLGQQRLDAFLVLRLVKITVLRALPGQVAGRVGEESLFVLAIPAGLDQPRRHRINRRRESSRAPAPRRPVARSTRRLGSPARLPARSTTSTGC